MTNTMRPGMANRFLFIVNLAVLAGVGVAHGGWSTQFGPTGLVQMGYVTAAVEYEGDLVVAGFFNTAGGDTVNHIARWDGERWRPLGAGLWGVECLAVHAGRLIAGGKFKPEGGVRFYGLSYWDGESWQRLSDQLEGEVHALVSYRGDLIVGGRFTIHGETPISYIARWYDGSWLPLGQGVARGGRTRVEALEVHADELIVGGVFGQAGQVETFHIARWDGRQWHAFGDGADDAVYALRSSGDHLYAAGIFQMMSGDSASCIADWDGVSWSPLGDGIRMKSPDLPVVNALEIWRGELVVAGKFDMAGGLTAGSIATWDGSEWRSRPPGFDAETRPVKVQEVLDLTVCNERLVAGGKMQGGAGFLVNNLGLWDGGHWDPLIAGQGVESGVGEMKYLGAASCCRVPAL
ncbi:MAG: hypothetical protein IPM94_00820 [bacterium]|nr:hypothetical protein [bacterium]